MVLLFLATVRDGSSLLTQWSYDGNGNRVMEVKPDGRVVTGTYDEQDRLLAYGDSTFTSTANGELVSKCHNQACQSFEYDVFGNLRQVLLDNGIEIEYVIDGRNRRVGKKINGTYVQGFVYDDQLRIVAELDGQNQVVSRFIYADQINVPELMEKGGRTYRILHDHLGSPRFVVDTQTGEIAQRIEYDAWGNVVFDSNPGFQPFGFAGGLYDPQTKLTRFGARDYDPQVGRWLSRDPLAFPDRQSCGSTNLYAYSCGSPAWWRDPSGLAAVIRCSGLKTEVQGWLLAACTYLNSPSCEDALQKHGLLDCMRRKCEGQCGTGPMVVECVPQDEKREWCGRYLDYCTIGIDYKKTKKGECGSPRQVLFHEMLHLCAPPGPPYHGGVFADVHQKCMGMKP